MHSRLSTILAAFLFAAATSAFAQEHLDFNEEHLDFYVSPSGSDDAEGDLSQPWKTPEAAVARLRDTMLAKPGTSVNLFFREGDYRLEKELAIDGSWQASQRANSSDAQASLPADNSNSQTPQLTLAAVPGEKVCFHGDLPVTGWKKWKGGIWKANLAGCGITDLGEPIGDENRVDLYRAGKRQTLARWPNEGFARAGKAMGETIIPYNERYGYNGTVEGIMGYRDARMDKWAKESEPCAFGYWYWDWNELACRVSSMDTHAKTMSFEKPYCQYGYRDSCRFYGFNLLCELDAPGEYYIDRSKGVIYWYAPEGCDPRDEDLTLSVFHEPFMLAITNAENVSVVGIDFRGSRRGAISIDGGRSVNISKCSFNCFGNTVMSLQGGKGHHIDRCTFDEMGYGGIVGVGGDRKTLESCEFAVTNTVFENFSLFKRTGAPAIHFGGDGLLVAHCHFESSPSIAIGVGGNDITVEYNEFFDVVNENDDMGAIDSYYDYSFRREVFRYNHFRDIKGGIAHGAAGIRMDDIISGQIIYGNVFENCGDVAFGAVQLHGGKDNWVSNNLFYDCKYAISFSPWTDEKWDSQFAKQMNKCEAVDCFGPLYRMRYPELNEDPKDNHNRNYSSNNLAVNVSEMYYRGDYVAGYGNTLLQGSTEPLSYFLNPEVLAKYGLKPIPFEKIGLER